MSVRPRVPSIVAGVLSLAFTASCGRVQSAGTEPSATIRMSTGFPSGNFRPFSEALIKGYAQLLPEPIRKFTQPAAIQDAEHLSFIQGGGHGGSHPHLAHNWLMAILGKQPPLPDAETSVNWTMVGICAHESALRGGERIQIPRF